MEQEEEEAEDAAAEEAGDEEAPADEQSDQALDKEAAAEADQRWSAASGRPLPLEMPVLFLSGSDCCTVIIETLESRVSDLKAQVQDRTGIPHADQDLLCEGAVSALKDESRLRNYEDLLSKASHFQLVRKEPEEVRECLRKLEDENVLVRSLACAELGKLGSWSGIALLEKALSDPEWTVRQNAAVAIGRFGDAAESCIPALEEAMRTDEDTNVRMHAAGALRGIGPAAIPVLVKALKEDENEIARIWAAEALGKMTEEDAVPGLKETMQNDSSIYVRYAAAEAIKTISCKEVVEPTQSERIASLYAQVMKSANDLETTMNARQRFLDPKQSSGCNSKNPYRSGGRVVQAYG